MTSAVRRRSLACVRVRQDERQFVGCGRGWEADDDGSTPVCDRCGRSARVTGSYVVISLGAEAIE